MAKDITQPIDVSEFRERRAIGAWKRRLGLVKVVAVTLVAVAGAFGIAYPWINWPFYDRLKAEAKFKELDEHDEVTDKTLVKILARTDILVCIAKKQKNCFPKDDP